MSPEVRLEIRDSRAVVTFDTPGRPVNTLGTTAIHDLELALDTLESHRTLAGALLVSAKAGNFLSGADLDELDLLRAPEEATVWVERGQAALRRLERLAFPTVALVRGAALGGGLELALACTYRVAAEDPVTQLGLPEVQLGLCPALGGTWRLPRRAGFAAGLELLLSGRRLGAREAWAAGLVDEVVPAEVLEAAALRLLAERPRPRRGGGAWRRLAAGNPLGRALILGAARRAVRSKGADRLPAPGAILAAARAGAARGGAAAERVEAREFGALALSEACRSLVALFRAAQAARPARAERFEGEGWRVGVLGAGLMGSGIAQVAARAGHPVRLFDLSAAALGLALDRAAKSFASARRRRRWTAAEERAARARLAPTLSPRGFGGCRLVIEAIAEDLTAKRELLARIAADLAPDAILASNTSTLPIADLSAGLPGPERVVGLHFFSPVPRMPLVEIVRHPGTSERTIELARRFVAGLGKTAIVVRDGPGFYTSRILAPYLAEAAWLLAAGHTAPEIDESARALGFPVGPLTLVDEIGLDVAARAAAVLAEAFPDRLPSAEPFARLVAAGHLGRKSGHGFYDYRGPVRRPDLDATRGLGLEAPRRAASAEELSDRLLFAMVAEAVRCLEDGILAGPRDGDLGAVLGLGFPPDLGGPFRWLDRIGAAAALGRLEALAAVTGAPLFQAPESLVALAGDGSRFHA